MVDVVTPLDALMLAASASNARPPPSALPGTTADAPVDTRLPPAASTGSTPDAPADASYSEMTRFALSRAEAASAADASCGVNSAARLAISLLRSLSGEYSKSLS